MENFGDTINLEKSFTPNRRRRVKDGSERQENEMSRRDFIKRVAKAGLGISTLGIVAKGFREILKEEAIWENLEKRSEEIKENYQEKEVEQKEREIKATPEQEEIRQEDSRIIGKTIEEQLLTQDQVVLNLETKNALKQKWKESYSPKDENKPESGRNYLGLIKAMEKMQPWLALMKAEFEKVGVPEKFVYLAIPESHFDLNAFSRAYAKGPYQFIESSAKAYGLKIDEKVDFRCDPIESARACAQHLKDSYERFNNDWDLAFADYNGGFTNKYAQFRTNKKDRNYEDYLKWREGRLNDYLRKKKKGEYSVKKGDTLFRIAKKFGISVDRIKTENNLTGDVIKLGQKLKIADKTFNIKDLGDSLENLNYPEKFYAILDVIEEQKLEEKFPAEKLDFDLMEVPRADFLKDSYFIRKGDTLFWIAESLKKKLVSKNLDLGYSINSIMNLITSQNGIKNRNSIQPGQKLVLRIPISVLPSLASIAKNEDNLKKLQALNPAIRSPKNFLPSDYKIRVPRGLFKK
jgi:membrane-bound lytic murein transglycosylase D